MSAQAKRALVAGCALAAAVLACVLSAPLIDGLQSGAAASDDGLVPVEGLESADSRVHAGLGLEGDFQSLPLALFEQAGGSVPLSSQLPQAFGAEVLSPREVDAVQVASSGNVVGLVCEPAEDLLGLVVESMAARGWAVVEQDDEAFRGPSQVVQLAKGDGVYRWACVTLYHVGDSVTCVFQLLQEETE